MKKFILFAHVCKWSVLVVPLSLTAQDSLNTYPNYVVIGAFAIHKNAVDFTKDANRHSFPARFEMNFNRNLYYVYVLATDDRQNAIDEALRHRAETKYFDTWVYSGPFQKVTTVARIQREIDVNPETGSEILHVKDENTAGGPPVVASLSGNWSVADERRTAAGSLSDIPVVAEDTTPAVLPASDDQSPERIPIESLTAKELADQNFFFHLFRADNGDSIAGEVEAIDFERSRKMASYKANKPVHVIMASTKSGKISFVCQVFGYRKQQIEFDPASLSPDFYLDDSNSLIIPFELIRLQKGDIAIMYNVFFFKDAAVMRPESRYEVNNLLDLLVENPSYEIVIHGHTNGNAAGRIIRMNTPDNFYSLTGTKQGFGSAKQLSEERAVVIRDYLISSGISADRMHIKAWGGKKPIYDKHSPHANENVRVEVEILR